MTPIARPHLVMAAGCIDHLEEVSYDPGRQTPNVTTLEIVVIDWDVATPMLADFSCDCGWIAEQIPRNLQDFLDFIRVGTQD